MSIRRSSGDPVYKQMIETLESKKMRIVYDEKQKKFAYLTNDEAKQKASDADYITDLPRLKTKVEEYIQDKGISIQDKLALLKAFEKKAEVLKGRFILWGGDKRDAAVGRLEEFPEAIEHADEINIVALAKFSQTPQRTNHQSD